MENDTDDVDLEDVTAIRVVRYNKKPNYNMKMVCHIEEKEDTDRDNLVQRRVFKPTSGNVTK